MVKYTLEDVSSPMHTTDHHLFPLLNTIKYLLITQVTLLEYHWRYTWYWWDMNRCLDQGAFCQSFSCKQFLTVQAKRSGASAVDAVQSVIVDFTMHRSLLLNVLHGLLDLEVWESSFDHSCQPESTTNVLYSTSAVVLWNDHPILLKIHDPILSQNGFDWSKRPCVHRMV